MPVLYECPALEGFSTIIDRDPRIEALEDILFMPGSTNGGLYDRGRRLLPGSGYFRGLPNGHGMIALQHGQFICPIDPDTVKDVSHEPLFFGGVLIDHFGHFLIGTLSRFWNSDFRHGRRILVINDSEHDTDRILNLPFVKTLFGTLFLAREDFVCLDRPTMLTNIILAHPSFEENNLAHRIYGRLCAKIGKTLAPKPLRRAEPIFISKTNLKQGIHRLINEDTMCEVMQKAGVQIVFPEDHTVAEQIALFRGSPMVFGVSGSGLHTSAFAPGCKLVIYNFQSELGTNQKMIDTVAGNQSTYLYAPHGVETLPLEGPWQVHWRAVDPVGIAEDMLRHAERVLA